VYAIKVYLSRPKKSGLATKDGYFMETALQKNYYLMRDFEDNVVHVFTRKEKAQKIVNELQEQNPKMLIQLTEDIPAAALARALKKKGNETKATETNESSSKGG
jgi:predicted CoA-binding protein